MNVKEAVEWRRSIRKFKEDPVPEELLREAIDAARLAPSGNNAQPARFIVVASAEAKEKLRGVFFQDFVLDAPAIIVCYADPSAYPERKKVKGMDMTSEQRALRDVSIASAFLVLRATELGLGTAFIGWMDKEAVKPLLGIPAQCMVPFVVLVGYAAEKPGGHDRLPLDDIMRVK
ncbi:MAG: nitroreductase family protein [Candidatus Diapherotrites archaeon]|nr:nitroreductase family protein [Candidatus Diapherotrites archaeon]